MEPYPSNSFHCGRKSFSSLWGHEHDGGQHLPCQDVAMMLPQQPITQLAIKLSAISTRPPQPSLQAAGTLFEVRNTNEKATMLPASEPYVLSFEDEMKRPASIFDSQE